MAEARLTHDISTDPFLLHANVIIIIVATNNATKIFQAGSGNQIVNKFKCQYYETTRFSYIIKPVDAYADMFMPSRTSTKNIHFDGSVV